MARDTIQIHALDPLQLCVHTGVRDEHQSCFELTHNESTTSTYNHRSWSDSGFPFMLNATHTFLVRDFEITWFQQWFRDFTRYSRSSWYLIRVNLHMACTRRSKVINTQIFVCPSSHLLCVCVCECVCMSVAGGDTVVKVRGHRFKSL